MNTYLHACAWITKSFPQVRGTSFHDSQEQADDAATRVEDAYAVVYVLPVEERA